MIKVIYNKVCGRCVQSEPLTSGIVGQPIHFEYSHDFDGLTVTAVFTDGKNTVNVVNPGNECIIPHEVLTTVGAIVKVGIYAVKGDELVIPTIYAHIGVVQKGADPSGDVSADPTLPVWAQIQGIIGNLNDLDTEAKNNLVAAINEAAQTGGSGGSTVELDTTLTQSGKAADAKAVGDALAGKQDTISDLEAIRTGAAKGATALQSVPNTYRTASEQDTIDGGKVDKVVGKGLSTNDYTDAAKAKVDALAPVATSGSYNDLTNKPTIPTALPNPNALTFTGAMTGSYDGSAPLSVEIPSGGGVDMGITGATVGQIAKITAVDASGTPTAWAPVDMPTGVGGSSGGIGELRRIAKVTLTEDAGSIEITTDEDGNAFELVEYTYLIIGKSLGTSGNVGLKINDTLIYYGTELSNSNTTATLNSGGHGSYVGGWYATYKSPFNASIFAPTISACKHNVGKMKKFWYGCTSGAAGVGFQAGTVLELWGR